VNRWKETASFNKRPPGHLEKYLEVQDYDCSMITIIYKKQYRVQRKDATGITAVLGSFDIQRSLILR
jgi:hypothetical protein